MPAGSWRGHNRRIEGAICRPRPLSGRTNRARRKRHAGANVSREPARVTDRAPCERGDGPRRGFGFGIGNAGPEPLEDPVDDQTKCGDERSELSTFPPSLRRGFGRGEGVEGPEGSGESGSGPGRGKGGRSGSMVDSVNSTRWICGRCKQVYATRVTLRDRTRFGVCCSCRGELGGELLDHAPDGVQGGSGRRNNVRVLRPYPERQARP